MGYQSARAAIDTGEPANRLLPPGPRPPLDLEEAAVSLLGRIPRAGRRTRASSVTQFNGEQIVALMRRRGWDGRTGGTLTEAGDLIGITRERVRQLNQRLEDWSSAVVSHADDEIPGVLVKALNIGLHSTSDAVFGHALAVERVTTGYWSLSALASLLRLCGRRELDQVILESAALGGRSAMLTRLVPRAVWNASKKLGFAHSGSVMDSLRSQLADERGVGGALLDAEIGEALLNCNEVMPLPHDYYYCAPFRTSTIVETTRRMLTTHEPLDLRAVRDGLRRRCKFRRVPFRVPLDVLRSFFSLSPEFELDEHDRVRSTTHYSTIPDTLQHWIVDQIRQSDYGLLTRNQVMSRARQGRKNANSVSIYLTYGEQIAHDKRGFFFPVGCAPNENVIATALGVAGAMARRTVQTWHFDGARDVVTILLELGDTALSSGVVITEPAWRSYLDLLGEHHYKLVDEDGVSRGSVYRSEPMSAIAGLSTLIAHTYPEPGDILRLRIDRRTMTAQAEIGGFRTGSFLNSSLIAQPRSASSRRTQLNHQGSP